MSRISLPSAISNHNRLVFTKFSEFNFIFFGQLSMSESFCWRNLRRSIFLSYYTCPKVRDRQSYKVFKQALHWLCLKIHLLSPATLVYSPQCFRLLLASLGDSAFLVCSLPIARWLQIRNYLRILVDRAQYDFLSSAVTLLLFDIKGGVDFIFRKICLCFLPLFIFGSFRPLFHICFNKVAGPTPIDTNFEVWPNRSK